MDRTKNCTIFFFGLLLGFILASFLPNKKTPTYSYWNGNSPLAPDIQGELLGIYWAPTIESADVWREKKRFSPADFGIICDGLYQHDSREIGDDCEWLIFHYKDGSRKLVKIKVEDTHILSIRGKSTKLKEIFDRTPETSYPDPMEGLEIPKAPQIPREKQIK